jgi:hypothetical protein
LFAFREAKGRRPKQQYKARYLINNYYYFAITRPPALEPVLNDVHSTTQKLVERLVPVWWTSEN